MTNMVDKQKILDKIEYVLGMVAAVGLLLFVFLSMSSELKDPDIWLHLKAGEYIIQHRAVPMTDIFSATLTNKPWIDHSWLVQVIFYLVFHFGGADNLIFLSAITITFAFLLLFFTFYQGRKYLSLNLGILFITILASKLRFNIRPENFSILFFTIYLFMLASPARRGWIYLLVPVQVIWANCHGFFIIGPLMVGVFILAEKLKQANLLPWEWAKTDPWDNKTYAKLIRLFFLLCLACFINPNTYKGALYPLQIIFHSISQPSIYYKYIEELLPTWTYYKATYLYFVFIGLSLALFIMNFRKINLAYLILWSIFLSISFKVNRNIIFFNFMAFIVTADSLIKSANSNRGRLSANFPGKTRRFAAFVLRFTIICVLICWSFKTCNSVLQRGYYIFEENRLKSSLLGIGTNCPVKAADFILENDLPENIFNLFNHGSYLIYRLYPRKKVFIDGRTEVYKDAFFKNYQAILNSDEKSINDTFNKYNINTVILSEAGGRLDNLGGYFFNKKGWALVYFSTDASIFLKDIPKNELLISRLKLDLNKWKTEKAKLDEIGLKRVYPDPYINRAWKFYYFGLDEQALDESREALRVLPSASDAYNIMGRIYLKRKLYGRAFQTLRLASIYAPFDTQTLVSLGDYYAQTDKLGDAIKIYRKLTKLDPNFAEGYYLLGRTYSKQNDTKLAVSSLRHAVKLEPFSTRYSKKLDELLKK